MSVGFLPTFFIYLTLFTNCGIINIDERSDFVNIPSVVIQSVIAIGLIVFGISQIKSDSVAHIGTTNANDPIRNENITDIRRWNMCHGLMWVIYGILYLGSSIASLFIVSIFVVFIIALSVTIIPLPFMCLYHNHLKKKLLIYND